MNLSQTVNCPHCKTEWQYEINHVRMSDEKLFHCSAETGSCGKWFVVFFEIKHNFKLAKVDNPVRLK